jgi:hypothetical protein
VVLTEPYAPMVVVKRASALHRIKKVSPN